MTQARRAANTLKPEFWGTRKIVLVLYALGIGLMLGNAHGERQPIYSTHEVYLVVRNVGSHCSYPKGLSATADGQRLECKDSQWTKE